MKRTESEYRELRWRVKGSAGLVVLGAVLGGLAWLWPVLGGDADLLQLIDAAAEASGDFYFWAVSVLSAALGGWLAMLLFWRGGASGEQPRDGGPDGMAGPKF